MTIDVTNCDLRQIVRAAYDLSQPLGMGFLHAKPGPIDEETVDKIIAVGSDHYPLQMDYVRGRAVKLTVFQQGGRRSISDRWYDHSDAQLRELCKAIGAEMPTESKAA